MTFRDLAQSRYSVRKFSNIKITQNQIQTLLDTAQSAPTAVNYQPQRVVIIQDPHTLDALKKCTTHHFNAPLAFIIGYDLQVSWKRSFDGYDSGAIDASIFATHIMLQATEMGLGTCWVGHFEADKINKVYNLPETFIPVVVMLIGVPAADAEPASLHSQRLPVAEYLIQPSIEDSF